MDQYNVITPTNNLDDLDRDMNNWYLLPFEMRMRSNDECMRRNGCTIQDYYNRMRTSIIKHQDQGEYKPNNLEIMKEDAYGDLITDVNFSEKKAMSNDYNQSPFIVIIDPDVKDIDELSRLYDSYLLLSPRNRLLSNEYSYSIWGYNVQNMRDLLMGKFETGGKVEDDNIVKESISYKELDRFAADRLNHCFMYDNILEREAIIANTYNRSSDIINWLKGINRHDSLEESYSCVLPTATPYFTAKEIRERGYKINIPKDKSYVKALKEAKTEEEFLALGWNPSIAVNEKSIKFAKNRQILDIFGNNKVYDISEMKLLEFDSNKCTEKQTSYPFIVVREGDSYYAAGNITLNKLVCLNKNPGKIIYRDDLGDKIVEVAVFGVDSTISAQFGEINNFNYKAEGIDFGSIYDVMKKPLNKYDPAIRRIYYEEMADILNKYFTNFDSSIREYSMENEKKFFVVYTGSLNSGNINVKEIFEKFFAISSESTMKKILSENYNMSIKQGQIEVVTEWVKPINIFKGINKE